jgi:hypothetical protein
MDTMIAFCGLDCAACDARKATLTNDDALRARTAEAWTKMFSFPFSKEMINCTGCKEPGVKVGHCAECELRTCGLAKTIADCGACTDYHGCAKIKTFIAMAPHVKANLERPRAQA